jgi:hypothetical protein
MLHTSEYVAVTYPSFFDCREEIEDEPHALWRVIKGDKFKDRHLTGLETLETLTGREDPGSLAPATRLLTCCNYGVQNFLGSNYFRFDTRGCGL